MHASCCFELVISWPDKLSVKKKEISFATLTKEVEFINPYIKIYTLHEAGLLQPLLCFESRVIRKLACIDS
jgi:hypothetical protein